jgi:amino acid adenylation domain-containing protein
MSKHLFAPNVEFSTLIELLRWRAIQNPKQQAYTFLHDGEVEATQFTYVELDRQARAIGATLQSYGAGGERALLLYQPGLEYIAAFFGCLYAGVVAVPAYPPQLNRSMTRLQSIVADAQATVVLTTTQVLSNVERWFASAPELGAIRWLTTDSIASGAEKNWQEPTVTGDTLAFLQYTSGSTAAPKGVMVNHANLLHNELLIQQAFEHQSQSTVVVGWLPLYHDMGLIGNVLQPLYIGAPCILMSPVAFLQKPIRWLQAISRYKATTSGGPNFAYDLCVRRISQEQRENLDLSSWNLAFNGAEPIRYETLERFATAFKSCGFRWEAFYPCYGMAETTLIVSGGKKATSPVLQTVQKAALEQNQVVLADEESDEGQTLVSCGRTLLEQQIVIVHPETLTCCSADEVGEIWVSGCSVAQGYWRRPEETKTAFQAYLADTGAGPFFRTGDLGFIKNGELFVTGRLKDLIIIRGRNHYPQDIELTVERSHPALKPSSGAAFSVNRNGEERLVVVQEVERSYLRKLNVNEGIRAIRQAVTENHELQVYAVLLLKTGSIPKTSSGKIQRHACRSGFLDGSLEVVGSSILEDSDFTESEDTFKRDVLQAAPEDRQTLLEAELQNQLARLLKVRSLELNPQQPLNTFGLDSLIAVELKNSIETNLGVTLPITTLLQDSTSIARLATEIGALLTTPPTTSTIPTPERLSRSEYPLSYGQQALWFVQQLAPESPIYNIVGAARIRAELDIPSLQRAFQILVNRHPCLRTTFAANNGKPLQQVREHVKVCLQLEDASTWSESSLRDRLLQEAHSPFNLEQDSLLRVKLFTRSAREHVLLLAVHHIVADFWSLAVLVHELGNLYQAEKNGTQVTLAPLSLKYADYVRWQAAMLASTEGERLWAYWQKQLAGELPVLDLPTDRARAPVQTYRGASHSCKLSVELAQGLKALSRNYGATLYMTLLAVLQVLLHRYTNQEDILVGSPTAGRNAAELAGIVGYFANPLVLRANLSDNPTFEDFLGQVRQTVLDALAHQDYPFALLVERLQPIRDAGRSPLFQVMFVLQKAHLQQQEGLASLALGETGTIIEIGGLQLESLALEQRVAQFDLTLMMAEVDGSLSASWQYNSDLFDAATIARMAEHFQTLLESAIANPQQCISNLPMLTAAEQHQLLVDWNKPQLDYPKGACIHQLFEVQVERTPDAIAVVFEKQQLTYQQLNEKANQLAHHLQTLGVGPDVLVGICVDRCLEMIVGILGILKAGGAYVPLDPTYPLERLAFMLEDTQVKVLLTQQQLLATLSTQGVHVVCLDNGCEALARESLLNPVSQVTADNLAYVIYTSGSTGKPKGVLVNHHNVVRLFAVTQSWFHFGNCDVWTLFHSYAFDFSVWEIWGALLHGGRLVIVPYWTSRSPDAFYNLLCTKQVTVLNQTPSAFRQLMRTEEELVDRTVNLENLRLVIFGGEALELKSLQPWFERHGDLQPQLVNMYGITEITVHATYRPLTVADLNNTASVIGRPLPDLQFYLLDRYRQLVPIGVTGEIYIGGTGVARGYLNRPDMTVERFISNCFQNEGKQNANDTRLYRTGDLARYLPNGDIEYLGRIDRQVKIRGFRIEIGEIEAALHQHPAIREAVVLVQETEASEKRDRVNPGTDLEDTTAITELRRFLKAKSPKLQAEAAPGRLVAYCVCGQQPVPTVTELRCFLQEKLPEYMIPSAFAMLKAFPLTANGKLDRRALPALNEARPDLEKVFVAPRTPIEQALAEIWSQVLGIEQVGIHDNFFELGGDSIRSIQVRAKAQAKGLNFSLPQLFRYQTIHKLAPEILSQSGCLPTLKTEAFSLISEEERQKLPESVEDAYPLARIQAGVIFHSQYSPDSPMYHDIFLYHLQVCLDVQIFETSVQQVVNRHPILRTSFDLTNFTEPLQLVHKTVDVPLQVEDWRSLSPAQQKQALSAWIETEKSRHFDWNYPPLIRFFIHRIADESFYLILSFHDCILDGWSTASLLTELITRYCSLLNEKSCPTEPQPTVSYRDFIALEQLTLKSQECRDYWTQKLRDRVITKLPRWTSNQETKTPQIGVLNVPISSQLSEGLKKLARLAEVPVKHVLLAAHLRVMSLLSGQLDVMTGLESNGRLEEADGDKTLGIHLNTVPFRLKLTGGTWIELVQQVFANEQELLAFRRYPYADLQKIDDGGPLVETVFNYTHFHVFKKLQALKGLEILGAQGFGETHFTLRVEFNREPYTDSIQLDLECDLTEIGNAQLEAIGSYYFETLTAMSNQPFARYESQCLLSEPEKYQQLMEWNNTATEHPQNWCIHQWFETQVANNPNAIALVFENQQLSYQELNCRANALAHYLQKLGVGPDVPVALCVERSPEMVVGILGILKAGGAYVPLDPAYPQEHLAFILEDTQVPVLLTQARLVPNLPTHKARVVCLDLDWHIIAQESQENPLGRTISDNLAYIIYTSGSTGRPKGVLVTHNNLIHSTSARSAYYLEPVTSFLLVPSFAFDSSVAVIFWTLCQAGTLILLKEGWQKDIWQLAKLIAQHHVSHWLSVPSLYKALLAHTEPSQLASLRTAIVAGESCSGEIVERHRQLLPHASLFNEYGPTEGTVWSSVYNCQNYNLNIAVPIGRPIANTQIYLLNSHLQPVPIGVAGELYLGGLGIARGYLNHPELTAQKFIAHPFSDAPGARLYKTGDLARYLPDGNIEFLGRIDFQVKVRGYRIELTEIEAVLQQHPGVRYAVVLARGEESSSKRLIAYIVPEQKFISTAQLRRFLRGKLPEHMVPNAFVILDALPLTPNGKVNRQLLPAPEQVQPSDDNMEQILQKLEHLSADEVKAILAKKKLSTRQDR